MIIKIAACGAVMAMVCAVLSELGFRGKRIVSALFIALILLFALLGAGEMLSDILGLARLTEASAVCTVALKVVGVGYLFGFISDLAEELGERGIASALLCAGRVEILLLVFPHFLEICRLGVDLW
jgi:hypothetical protein